MATTPIYFSRQEFLNNFLISLESAKELAREQLVQEAADEAAAAAPADAAEPAVRPSFSFSRRTLTRRATAQPQDEEEWVVQMRAVNVLMTESRLIQTISNMYR